MEHCRYIIESYTEDGRKFRPSDWIDRIASLSASYGAFQRLVFSNMLYPELYQGQRTLIVDTALEDVDPVTFNYVMHFVKSNHLKISKVCEVIEQQLGS